MVKFRPGKDFDMVVVSIDPSETPEMAAKEEGASTSSATVIRKQPMAGIS